MQPHVFENDCEPSNVDLDPNIVVSRTMYLGKIVSFLKYAEQMDIQNQISSTIYKNEEFNIPVVIMIQNDSNHDSDFRYRLNTSIYLTITYDTRMKFHKKRNTYI